MSMEEFMDKLKFHLECICEVVWGYVDVCRNDEEIVVCLSTNMKPHEIRMIELETINFVKSYKGWSVSEIKDKCPVEIIVQREDC